jgi:hypothetical protein
VRFTILQRALKTTITIASLTFGFALSLFGQSNYRIVTNQLFDISRSKAWRNYQIEITSTNLGWIAGVEFRNGTNWRTGYLTKDRNDRIIVTNVFVLNAPGPQPSIGSEYNFKAIVIGVTNFLGANHQILDCGTIPSQTSASTTNAPAEAKNTESKPWVSNEWIEVTTDSGKTDRDGGMTITGKLTSKASKKTLAGLSIRFNIYDDAGNKIGQAHDYIGSLEPGETWKFKATTLSEVGSYSLDRVTSNQGRLD